MLNDIEKVLLSEQDLKEIVERLGAQITEDYKDKKLVLVSVLKGSVIFMADLMRAIKIPCEIDFMAVSSYGSGTKSSGIVRIIKDLDAEIVQGSDLLIVEDILDSGRTLKYLMEILSARKPASIKICTLLDKPKCRAEEAADLNADYSGAEIPDAFVVGYGLDYDEKYRNLPFVGIVKPEVYQNKE